MVRIKTFPSQRGFSFSRQSFWVPTIQSYVIFKIECFVPYLHSKWSDLKNSFTNRGHFFFMLIILRTNNPMLSPKLNILSQNPHSKWSDLKNSFTNRGCFFFQDDHFEYQQSYCNIVIIAHSINTELTV